MITSYKENMALRKIVEVGDDALRKVSRNVSEVNDHIKDILLDMVDTMRENMGVGLAAPQVGILRRMFVAEPKPLLDIDDEDYNPNQEEKVYFMINPEIIEQSDDFVSGIEGCLSVPGEMGTVLRPSYIKMKALDFNGVEQIYEFYDFDARVMLHEYDHLDGILYIDKAVEMLNPEDLEEDDK